MNSTLDQEIFAMKLMNHPNVIKLKAFLVPENQNKVYIITEFCEGPNIAQLIKNYSDKNMTIPKGQVMSIFKQIVEGMIHINQHGKH